LCRAARRGIKRPPSSCELASEEEAIELCFANAFPEMQCATQTVCNGVMVKVWTDMVAPCLTQREVKTMTDFYLSGWRTGDESPQDARTPGLPASRLKCFVVRR
jgi:hypothetical protein